MKTQKQISKKIDKIIKDSSDPNKTGVGAKLSGFKAALKWVEKRTKKKNNKKKIKKDSK